AILPAQADGHLSIEVERDGARSNIEVRGVSTFVVEDREGAVAARVFLTPGGQPGALDPAAPLIPGWAAATMGTTLIALLLAFALSGRILRPVEDLTKAARRMREGELAVRVAPRGDDEIARLARAFNDMAERLAQTERAQRQRGGGVADAPRSPVHQQRV